MGAGVNLRKFRRTVVAVAVSVIVLATGSEPALAGYVAGSPTVVTGLLIGNQGTRYCARAQSKIGNSADPADAQGWVRSAYWDPTSCEGTAALQVAPGWLRVRADEYRNGAFCGQTSTYESSTSTSLFGVGGVVCSNPSGIQSFHAVGVGFVYNAQTGNYAGSAAIASPAQSY